MKVAILGAGPVGLDAALACTDAGMDGVVHEAGPAVGAGVRAWGHVRLFTPWELNVSLRTRRRVTVPDEICPTGDELVDRLLEPVAALPELSGRIRLGHRVVGVGRHGMLKHEEIGTAARHAAPFRLLIDGPGGERVDTAEAILDCTGTDQPNTLGDGGLPAPGERALDDRIIRTLPRVDDPARWAGTVLLVGAGKSAQTAARDLAMLADTRVEWVVRDPRPGWGEIPGDTLPERQRLVEVARELAAGGCDRVRVHTGARVAQLRPDGSRVHVVLDTGGHLMVDHILSLTGYVGDGSLYRQLQIHECYATAAPMNLSAQLLGSAGGDCLAQPAPGPDVLRNPEPNFFILGAKSYGRLNTFLLRTGYQQVDQVMAMLGGTSA